MILRVYSLASRPQTPLLSSLLFFMLHLPRNSERPSRVSVRRNRRPDIQLHRGSDDASQMAHCNGRKDDKRR